jgi:hypothetical protein
MLGVLLGHVFLDRRAIAEFLLAKEVALQLDVNILSAKDVHKPLDGSASFFDSAAPESCSERAIVAASQANQSFSVFLQFIF